MPQGVTASRSDIIRVYAYNAPIIDNGMAFDTVNDGLIKSVNAAISSDGTKATYSMSLPKGNYAFAVRYLSGNKNISGSMHYYSSNGITYDFLCAESVSLQSTKTVNFIFKKAESYITGKIDFSDNVPTKDTYIGINMSANSSGYNTNSYIYLDVPAGTTEMDYQLGLDKAEYSMYVSSLGISNYYSSDGLVSVYNKRRIFNSEQPIENLNITAGQLLNLEYYNITFNFSSPLTEDHEYEVFVVDEDFDNRNDAWVNFEKGTKTKNVSLRKHEADSTDTKLYLAYKDITGFDSISWGFDDSIRYYSAELGYTSDKSKATDVSGMTDITITEPESYTVSGTLTEKNGANPYHYLYVGAEFDDELFYTRACLCDGTYSINIPKRMKNKTFKLFTAEGEYSQMLEHSKTYMPDTYILTKSLSGKNITAFGFKKVTGTITIPSPTPAEGLSFEVEYIDQTDDRYNYISCGNAVIQPNSKSTSYTAFVPEYVTDGYICINLYAKEKLNITSSAESSSLTDTNVSFDETVNISGTVSMPNGMTADRDITLQVSTNSSSYEYTYVTIPKDETSADYCVKAAKNSKLRYISTRTDLENCGLIKNTYYDKNGIGNADYTEIDKTIDSDMSMNLTLLKAAYVKGSISLPKTASYTSGQIGYGIYLKNIATNKTYNQSFNTYTPYADNQFSVPVLYEEGAEYKLYVYAWEVGESDIYKYKNYYYVTDTEMTYEENSAATVTTEGTYKLSFPICASISGTLSFKDDAMVKNGYLSGQIYAVSQNTNKTYYHYLNDFTSFKDINYRIQVPDDKTDTYKVYVNINTWSCEITNISNKKHYYSSAGLTTDENSATTVTQGAKINLAMPTMRYISGKITVPENFKQIEEPGVVRAELHPKSGSSTSANAYIDKDLNYVCYIEDDIAGEYALNISLGTKAVNNILKGTYWHESRDTYFNIEQNKNTNGKNIAADTGHAISGKVILSDDIVIKGYEFGYSVSYESYDGELSKKFTSTNRSIDYMLGIPTCTSAYGISAASSQSSNDGSESNPFHNLYTNTTYRIDNNTSTTDWSKAGKFTVNSDLSDINIKLVSAALVNITINVPDVLDEYINTEIMLVDKDGERIDRLNQSIWSGRDSFEVNMQLDKKYIGQKMYVYYHIEDNYRKDYLYNFRLYINPDGTFAHLRAEATPYIIGNEQNIEFTLATSDIATPDYVLESPHPYEKNSDNTYTYTHSTNAEQLYVTFDEKTSLEYGAKLYIIYTANNKYGYTSDVTDEYTYDQLSGKTILIPSNTFKVRLQATGSSTPGYGFAIRSVKEDLKYTVTFKNYDGSVLNTQRIDHGNRVTYNGDTPTRPQTDTTVYTFKGWQDYSSSMEITEDKVFTAQYTASPRQTISLYNSTSQGFAPQCYLCST